MQRLSEQLNFSADAAPLPEGFSDEIHEMCRNIDNPDTAKQVYNQLRPVLEKYRADQTMAITCGLLFEKQRGDGSMRPLWDDLQSLYPDDMTALRMLMRWYRRDGRTEDGIEHIKGLYPGGWYSLSQAKKALLGLGELKAWAEIDRLMETILVFHSHDRAIRMTYLKALNEQSRYIEAAQIARHVHDRDRMGTASQDLLTLIDHNALTMQSHGMTQAADAIEHIIAQADTPRAFTAAERVVFFSGQLGTGGAERQMTRIACAYQQRHVDGVAGAPAPQVWVKHANAATGADFYLPMLHDAGVPTSVLAEAQSIPTDALDTLPQPLKDLTDLLAPDIHRHTCQLIGMFREHKTDVAYLWQDGGIVQSAIAAVLAGVPRIVTSFRGLPPNLRKNFYRDELPVLYKALARLPHVSFTANSRKTAQAYEDWLSLPPGTVIVIPNAIPAVLPDGDRTDQAFWFDTVADSETCSKTVLGVFRFDDNKRPLHWVNAAARYLETHDDTRFIMLGNGALAADCQARIEELGLTNRIFLAGIRSNVGFYMHRADLLMHLAQMEGLPNVLIEAQLAGTPVLATPAGGTDEVVNNGVTGIILSQADELPEEELDTQLEALLSDQDGLARLGAAAMAESGERFSVDTILRTTTDLFNTIEQDT
ncbi:MULTISPECIES: glycosyltransferase [unclassified Roseovarius]|uniref:glycosyltransferase n=1 Tax=unclassified Roseovarius TaxID=2614913 RepID=UPI00273D8A98|nr:MULTISPECIES: glycosyltransferase [unclassified Roseovarius]